MTKVFRSQNFTFQIRNYVTFVLHSSVSGNLCEGGLYEGTLKFAEGHAVSGRAIKRGCFLPSIGRMLTHPLSCYPHSDCGGGQLCC